MNSHTSCVPTALFDMLASDCGSSENVLPIAQMVDRGVGRGVCCVWYIWAHECACWCGLLTQMLRLGLLTVPATQLYDKNPRAQVWSLEANPLGIEP